MSNTPSDAESTSQVSADCSRRSVRIASRQGLCDPPPQSSFSPVGVIAAPGLSSAQLRDLLDATDVAGSQNAFTALLQAQPSVSTEPAPPIRGRKRTSKSSHPEASIQKRGCRRSLDSSEPPPAHPAADSPPALDAIVSSLHLITTRLQALEDATRQPVLPHQASTSVQSALNVSPQFSLASASAAASTTGRSFIPQNANISASLRSQILQGKDINLIRLLLPSPECDKTISTQAGFSALLKTADPRLSRDLSIGEFLVAFGVFRDVICSVFPDRRKEFDTYLSIIGDLNLRYGRNIFYLYHKAFSSKAAFHISQFNSNIDWSVLDTELLVLVAGGQQPLSCSSCGALGHAAPLCPKLPFERNAAVPSPQAALPARFNDSRGRQVLTFNNKPICNNFNSSVCSYPSCAFLHICSACCEAHPKFVCPRLPSRRSPSWRGRPGSRKF